MITSEVIGYVGKDAEVKKHNDKEYVEFSVASSKNGVTTWVRCISYQVAIASYVKKGDQIYVRGNVAVKAYVDKQSQACPDFRIYAGEVQFLSSRGNGDAQGHAERPTSTKTTAIPKTEDFNDLPF